MLTLTVVFVISGSFQNTRMYQTTFPTKIKVFVIKSAETVNEAT